jgi:hypothetical protein
MVHFDIIQNLNFNSLSNILKNRKYNNNNIYDIDGIIISS